MHFPTLSHFAPLPTAVVVAFVIVSTFAVHTLNFSASVFVLILSLATEGGGGDGRRGTLVKSQTLFLGYFFGYFFRNVNLFCLFLLLTNKIDDLIELNSFHFEDERSNFSQCAWRSPTLVLSHDI